MRPRAAVLFLISPALLGAGGPPAPAPAPEGAHFVARYELSLHASPDGPGFRSPGGVSTDLFGNVFVADTGNHRVVQFGPDGRFVVDYGGYGWNDGEMSEPTDVCAREGFRVFVVDAGNERVQEFDIGDTSPVGVVLPFREGEGFEGEELVRPERMDIDDEGRIYVSDALCHCVWIFSPTGESIGRLGGLGEVSSRFRTPAGVAVDGDGNVYVADSGNRRIQVFDPIGNWRATWGGPDQDLFDEPVGIDVDEDGSVYVADVGTAEIRVLTPEGFPLYSFGGPGDGPGRFRAPVDVAVEADGVVWVVDEVREVVERYRIVREPPGE